MLEAGPAAMTAIRNRVTRRVRATDRTLMRGGMWVGPDRRQGKARTAATALMRRPAAPVRRPATAATAAIKATLARVVRVRPPATAGTAATTATLGRVAPARPPATAGTAATATAMRPRVAAA